ncbi:MAG TPA: phosphatase PAP2 family protein [Solirubrobacterales bacterium]|nr:phosphatase PAP2 family protein [Solirubrobacterales bacterium]
MARNVRAPLAGCLACIVGFAILAVLVHRSGSVQHFDAVLLGHFAERGSRTGSLAAGIVLLGDLGALLPLLAIACGIALKRHRPDAALAAVLVVAGANLSTQLFKSLLAHPRFEALLGYEQIGANSFPSGHTTAVASLAIAFAFVVPREWRPAVGLVGTGLVVAVGCSVMALDWHYPSDVLGGILVAAGWGFAVLAGLRATRDGSRRRSLQLGSRAAISVK